MSESGRLYRIRKGLAVLGRYAVLLFASLAVPSAWAADLRPGDYLEDVFIEALRASRSPYRALKEEGHGPQSINVQRDNGGLRFVGNLNWHEGWTLYTLTKEGNMQRGEENRDYPKPRIKSDTSFQFNDGGSGHFWHTYTWVGDADQAVVGMTLVGRYVDRSGRVVEFGADGVLHGFGPDTGFWLDNDHIENPFDFFYYGRDRSAPLSIAFENRGQALVLCPLLPVSAGSPSIGEPDCKHPRLVLKRLQSPREPF